MTDTAVEAIDKFIDEKAVNTEASGWRTYDFIVPPHRIDSEWGQALLRELEARGGHWERVFNGLLFICIPPGLDLDPTPWVIAR